MKIVDSVAEEENWRKYVQPPGTLLFPSRAFSKNVENSSQRPGLYKFCRGSSPSTQQMITRSCLELHVGCGVPVSPTGFVPRTPLSPSTYMPRPRDFNLDDSMFVAGVRKGFEEEFHRAISEAMVTYANQVSKLDATWPQSSAVAAGSSTVVPLFVGDDLLG